MPSVTSSPTSVTTTPNTGTLAVTNASNVLVADGVFATVTGDASVYAYSHAIVTSGYDFSAVPDDATLTLLTYRAKRITSVNFGVLSLCYWLPSGNGFSQLTPWSTSLVYESASLASSLPSVAVLKGNTFKFAIQISFENGNNGVVASLDHVELIVDYLNGVQAAASGASLDYSARGQASYSGRGILHYNARR